MSDNYKSKDLPYASKARQQTLDNTAKWNAIKEDAEGILSTAYTLVNRAIEERQFKCQFYICKSGESGSKQSALVYVMEKLSAKGYAVAEVTGTISESRAIRGGEDWESYDVQTLDLRISWDQ